MLSRVAMVEDKVNDMSAAKWLMISDKWLMIMPFDKKSYNRKSFRKGKVTPYKAKRGNLKPLMAEEQKSSANIQDLQGSLCWACRSNFACRITRLFQYLTEDAEPMEQREQSLKLVCWLCRVVTEEDDSQYKEYIMSKQVYRSGTSIGANVREAQLALSERNVWACSSISERGASRQSQHAQSDADFLSKMSIAYKEADESKEQREQ